VRWLRTSSRALFAGQDHDLGTFTHL